jgi:hypothetical protein
MSINPDLLPREDEKDDDLARAYLQFEHTEPKTPDWYSLFWTFDRMSHLTHHLPHRAWRVSLQIWSMHQCPKLIQNLPLKTLLQKHGPEMIPLMEAEAHRDPTFRKLLAGVSQERLPVQMWSRAHAASEGRTWDESGEAVGPEEPIQISRDLRPQDEEQDEDLVRAWLALKSTERKFLEFWSLFWAQQRMSYLTTYLPQKAWRIILLIWATDQSARTMQILSAGDLENLLARNGTEMIPLVEAEAVRDPSFAKLLGGVWKNSMTDEVWARLQSVRDRRGWDGIPE